VAALTVELLRKTFPAAGAAPRRHVLEAIRLELDPGEVVAITGASGCGKTTLLNLVAGLDRDFEGRIRMPDGTRLAYVFQEPRLLPWRTVRQNVALVLGGAADTSRRVETALGEVGLAGSAEVFASRLSLGMARRAALARAFVVGPDLLLLDEPFVSLDEATARRLRLLLLDLLTRRRTTALFVTHQLDEAVMMADRVVVLGGTPASVAAMEPVLLAKEERRDREAVGAARRRLEGRLGALAKTVAAERYPEDALP
jgi:ABC-type nitrate/sulfonate/bicarbonate transport system ATPase subunit